MGFFDNLFRSATPENALMVREVTPPAPGVPSSTNEQEPKVQGGDYQERIAYVRGPEQALVVGAVYRAVNLRADTMSVMPVQYQKRDFEGGNFMQDMRGLGKRINYLLQEESNPIMSASDLWKLVEINRLFFGNSFVYIERDEFGFPLHLWLVKSGGYNIVSGTYSTIVYLSDHDYVTLTNVPREDVMHFPNTFRYQNGIWGISTLDYAIETLRLNLTLRQQSLETAAKGGRVKLIIGEEKPVGTASTVASGLYNKDQMNAYAEELQKKMYSGHDILAIRGLDKVQNISMNAQEMQMFEQLGATNDDVARFFGVPRPLLMLDTNSHYNDYQNATMEFHTRTILPQKTGNEKEIARKLIPRPNNDPLKYYGLYRIHICEDPLMVMDPERRAKVALMKLQASIATPNEIRAEFDMPTVDDGDTPLASANLLTLKALLAKSAPEPGRPTNEEPKNNDTDDSTK